MESALLGQEASKPEYQCEHNERCHRTKQQLTGPHRYTSYKAVVQIVAYHYRTYMEIGELEARRSLTSALNDLAQL